MAECKVKGEEISTWKFPHVIDPGTLLDQQGVEKGLLCSLNPLVRQFVALLDIVHHCSGPSQLNL